MQPRPSRARTSSRDCPATPRSAAARSSVCASNRRRSTCSRRRLEILLLEADADVVRDEAPTISLVRGTSFVRRARASLGVGTSTWWFVLPALGLYAFIVLIPTARGSYYSFTDWDGLNPIKHWVGLDN